MIMASKTCPNCGLENIAERQTCKSCGTQLAQVVPGQMVRPTKWATTTSGRNTLAMGDHFDGWADLLDETGEKADELTQVFQQRMLQRETPNVSLQTSALSDTRLMGGQRPYHFIDNRSGATMAVYIGKFGRDLYMAWDLWLRPLPNLLVILGVIGLALLLAFNGVQGTFGGFQPNNSNNPFGNPNPLAMFASPGLILGFFIANTIFNMIWIGFLVGLAGKFLRGSWTAFYVRQLTLFEINDITAMTMAVHSSLLQAADAVGISTQLLRPKQQFRGGRRDRLI